VSLIISTVNVPGVRVIEFAKNIFPISDFSFVFAVIIAGSIGNEGDKTIIATSMLALIISHNIIGMYINKPKIFEGAKLLIPNSSKYLAVNREIKAPTTSPVYSSANENGNVNASHNNDSTIKPKNHLLK